MTDELSPTEKELREKIASWLRLFALDIGVRPEELREDFIPKATEGLIVLINSSPALAKERGYVKLAKDQNVITYRKGRVIYQWGGGRIFTG